MTPGTEAPAEMNTWFPDKKALWMAENCTGTLHNLYTLRGAQVRDGNAWAKYLMETVALYGYDTYVVFQSHNWPHWDNSVILEYLTNTAAMYKFINDQTLLYINQGYTSDEISGMIKLPADLEKVWYTRQYYGTLAHNSKAVYQRYMGWYDANPAHLNPLTPSDSAKKTVEYMGGADKVLKKAKEDFSKGEYQWVAEITMALVFDDPANTDARYLCADALEQLGYQAESGVWRAAYLTGAKELREGAPNAGISAAKSGDMLRAMEPNMIFDYMGIHLDSNAAQDLNLKINFTVTGDASYLVTVKSGVLLYQKDASANDADADVTLPKAAVALLLSPDVFESEFVKIEGDMAALQKLYGYMTEFDPYFSIIEP
jgi:alkyl sulfatase BDS1-like metallo-beta-lactamase superfamily hydrolase